ncbi:DUF3306 domain-containing protein [uncultured Thiohalocapsa sp.]|uniref:DUF3306 domain-containing protein n=1 Tax=uncultured Thiohalocapsa sp. TaxID=768990 RepID=UPI0025F019AF|nr:DUF3306 domain-containing protein [uncultured Thiohalocapsa sp.]
MSDADRDSGDPPATSSAEPLLTRWSRRKHAARAEVQRPAATTATSPEVSEPPGDDDMPPLASLDADSDYSPFLSPRVSEELQRLALRKLFHSPGFNVRDGLNDYDEDFTNFQALGDLVTADMRRQQAREAQASADADNPSPRSTQDSDTAATAATQVPATDRPEDSMNLTPADALDGPAHHAPSPKSQAMAAAAAVKPTPTGLIGFSSSGRLLLIGDAAEVGGAVTELAPGLQPSYLLTDAGPAPDERPAWRCARSAIRLSGHLGDFRVACEAGDGPSLDATFDLVLDLCAEPLLSMPVKPVGYFAPGADANALHEALAQLPELIGSFEKPQYFGYDPNICAHGRSGVTGCRRCLDVCPTQAIRSLAEQIEVDPNLCQGGGSCATVCPTGAISYQYPPTSDSLERVRRMLGAYAEAGGSDPVLLLHAMADPPASDADRVLPLPLEELASVGLECWLSALAYGASRVLLQPQDGLDATTVAALEQERRVANALLTGLGYPPAVQWVGEQPDTAPLRLARAARFTAGAGKRQTLFLAIDHLFEQAPAPVTSAALPAGAPLGQVRVDRDGCTLCLSCASVCPAKALSALGDRPGLLFYEANCVQCGLCAKACPEQVIALEPRVLYDPAQRRQPRTLNEEAPFCCVSCGKPFATRSVMDRMAQKLAGHHMFQDERSRRRLQMCGDCRVVDMMRDQA